MENRDARAGGPPPDEVLHLHHRLVGETEALCSVREVGQVLEHLGQLLPVLRQHFEAEEHARGFFDAVRERAPHLSDRVVELAREHGAILGDVDAAMARARACLDGPVADVLALAGDLAARVRAHEAREQELIMDVFNTDLGRGD